MFGVLLWASAAQAQWATIDDPVADRHAAQVCSTGKEKVCFELSCQGGAPLTWRMASEDVIDMVVAPSVRVLIFVGARLAGELEFQQTMPGEYEAPLEKWHEEGLKRLKEGASAELRLWFDGEQPPQIHRLGLRGSRDALTAVETACTKPDFEAREVARRTSQNPLVEILGDMKEACDALGGELRPREGLAEAIDIDGQDPIDLRVNHARAECSAVSNMVCGPSGCLTSLWLGLEGGDYRQAYEGNVQDLRMVMPGIVEMELVGEACDLAAGAKCKRRYALVGDRLELLAP